MNSSPPRVNKFKASLASPPPIAVVHPIFMSQGKTPRVSLLPEASSPFITQQTQSSKGSLWEQDELYRKVEEFLGKAPDLMDDQAGGYAFWMSPGIYLSVELHDRKDFLLTVRVEQKLSSKTIKHMNKLFKSSWYEPRGIHGVQTDTMEKALERFLIAHHLNEGKLSYEEIRNLNLKDKLEKDRAKFEKLISE